MNKSIFLGAALIVIGSTNSSSAVCSNELLKSGPQELKATDKDVSLCRQCQVKAGTGGDGIWENEAAWGKKCDELQQKMEEPQRLKKEAEERALRERQAAEEQKRVAERAGLQPAPKAKPRVSMEEMLAQRKAATDEGDTQMAERSRLEAEKKAGHEAHQKAEDAKRAHQEKMDRFNIARKALEQKHAEELAALKREHGL